MFKKLKDTAQGKAPINKNRSSMWSKVRKEYLKSHSCCAACGGTSKLEVHHIIPFHMRPDLELDPDNLIVLCESKSRGVVCHLFFGHLGNYKKVNLEVRQDASTWNIKFRES